MALSYAVLLLSVFSVAAVGVIPVGSSKPGSLAKSLVWRQEAVGLIALWFILPKKLLLRIINCIAL